MSVLVRWEEAGGRHLTLVLPDEGLAISYILGRVLLDAVEADVGGSAGSILYQVHSDLPLEDAGLVRGREPAHLVEGEEDGG